MSDEPAVQKPPGLVDFAGPVTLRTPRLVLRDISRDDVADCQVLDSDPAVVRYQSNDVLTVAGTRERLERTISEAARVPRRVFDLAITLAGEDRLIGRVGLAVRRPEHAEADVWFTLRRDAWGKGYATEALTAVLELAFERLGVHRAWGDCDPRNTRSARVMEKAGMRREAHLRSNWWLKGEWCDSWVYALLADEWKRSA